MSFSMRAGGLLSLDPNDQLLVSFDWDSEALPTGVSIASYVHTISVIRQSGATALTKDQESQTSRSTRLRLIGSTATLGDKYLVSSKITTNETPAQTIERSFTVLIENN